MYRILGASLLVSLQTQKYFKTKIFSSEEIQFNQWIASAKLSAHEHQGG